MTGRELIAKFRQLSQDEVEPYLWSDAVPAGAKLFLGATDDAGSEGIATISANAAPW